MARSRIVWVAGPIDYNERTTIHKGRRTIMFATWFFIGGDAAGGIHRWGLRYNVNRRVFSVTKRNIESWDKANVASLAETFRPIAVLRSDLPGRSINSALKAMLSDRHIAAASALSIKGGVI